MKLHHIIPAAALLLSLLAATSCKTSEANYRAAYEAAVESINEGYTTEELEAIAREEAMPKTLFRGDSIPLKGVYVNTVKLPGADSDSAARQLPARQYNVVVAQFKQRFNANSVLKRLQEGGFPDALLLIDRDQMYYIVAGTTDSLEDAVALLRRVESSSPVAMKSPCPFILRRPVSR